MFSYFRNYFIVYHFIRQYTEQILSFLFDIDIHFLKTPVVLSCVKMSLLAPS